MTALLRTKRQVGESLIVVSLNMLQSLVTGLQKWFPIKAVVNTIDVDAVRKNVKK